MKDYKSTARVRASETQGVTFPPLRLQWPVVTPAILKKGKPVAPVSPMEQHCRKLESQGLGDLADEMRHCGYDIMAWLRWQRGLGDDRGEEIPGEQALANEYQN